MDAKLKKKLVRVLVAAGAFMAVELADQLGAFAGSGGLYLEFACYLVPYFIAGYDVLAKAWHGIRAGEVFDECFLMAVATIGAFALVLFPSAEPHMAEGAAVMIFYQLGEWFQDYAVGKSRASIAEMMDIAPEYANLLEGGVAEQVDPYDVEVGSEILVKPGERVPLDGVVTSGSSTLDTAALTGESAPRAVAAGDEIVSGCINLTGALTVRTTKEYDDSTVARILELVEEASDRKARTENFITRFARVYTPTVVGLAVAIAVLTPLLTGQVWAKGVESALIFLVVSCPCALVISVPLSFFGGIGAASRQGILVKGSSYLETLASVSTVVFDKTGTLTSGSFEVVEVAPAPGFAEAEVLHAAAHAESISSHPVALSVLRAYGSEVDQALVAAAEERAGQGVAAEVSGVRVLVGNERLLAAEGIEPSEAHTELVGTVLHVAVGGSYAGRIVIADAVKPDAAQTIASLHAAGVARTVMLTGDREEVAVAVATQLGVDEYHAQLMPQDKVAQVERLLAGLGSADDERRSRLAFVGDGINDAPVLMRADLGIAMGAMGSDAAIEAADVVLMDDQPHKIATAIRLARQTMRIVWQNIVFAIAVKVIIMILALPFIGLANMWLAVFGDVGVTCLAILNSLRMLHAK